MSPETELRNRVHNLETAVMMMANVINKLLDGDSKEDMDKIMTNFYLKSGEIGGFKNSQFIGQKGFIAKPRIIVQ